MSHTPLCSVAPVAVFAHAPSPDDQKIVAAGSGIDSGFQRFAKGETVIVQAPAPATLIFYQGRQSSTRRGSVVCVGVGCTPVRLAASFDAMEITSSASCAVHVTKGLQWLGGSGE